MNNLSVIIPSRTAQNFIACAEAVRRHEPEARIILIDDGMDLAFLPRCDLVPCTIYRTGEPFQFSRNVNAGIKLAGNDDVVILNDDAILKTPGGLSLLQQAAEEHPEFGIIAATTNSVGNRNQYPQNVGLREDPRMVCFICVLIPRRTIAKVGRLDERFNCYSHQDDDYCLRVKKAGLKIGIHDGCFVDHATLKSTFRSADGPGGELDTGREIFMRIHGMAPEACA
jgi:GT2 family glycosyltransferase